MALTDLPDPGGSDNHLLDNMVHFCRVLRQVGMDVGSDRVMDALRALPTIDISSRDDFYFAARALLVSRREDLALFDAAFEMFWHARGSGPRQMVSVGGDLPRSAKPVVLPPSNSDDQAGNSNQKRDNIDDTPPVIEMVATYSTREVLRTKDFGSLTPDELSEIKRLVAKFVWQLGDRKTRRNSPGGDDRIDMRRTIRRNLRYGGEVVEWALRQPAYKPRRLILIADISGSMDRYTRLLVRFCYSVARSLRQPCETFVFSTHLTRITRQLKRRDVDAALSEVGQTVTDWSGGTRIGESLRAFNYDWGKRMLGQGAVVILISDGWDRGDAALLSQEMARLRRTCHRLIWLNPLLGSESYEPITYGMRAALPHVDDFMPVHNLASLEALADYLAALGGHSGRRRDYARRTG